VRFWLINCILICYVSHWSLVFPFSLKFEISLYHAKLCIWSIKERSLPKIVHLIQTVKIIYLLCCWLFCRFTGFGSDGRDPALGRYILLVTWKYLDINFFNYVTLPRKCGFSEPIAIPKTIPRGVSIWSSNPQNHPEGRFRLYIFYRFKIFGYAMNPQNHPEGCFNLVVQSPKRTQVVPAFEALTMQPIFGLVDLSVLSSRSRTDPPWNRRTLDRRGPAVSAFILPELFSFFII
jgi:hypothetical protein